MLTWNLGGNPPPESFYINEHILPKKMPEEESKDQTEQAVAYEEVDMFVVGLQEMVDLSMLGSISGKNDKIRTSKWQKVFKEALETRIPGRKFVCSARKIMFGCAVLLFVTEELVGHVKQIKTVKVKTGAGGIAANKGSTSIKFNFFDSSFLFLNCHLASG